MKEASSPSQSSLHKHQHGIDDREASPLLSSSTPAAVSTSPYAHNDTILRSSFLARKRGDNQQLEAYAHEISSHNTVLVFFWDTFSAITIFATMLISLDSIVGCALTVGATLLAYYVVPKDDVDNPNTYEWNGQMPSVLLSFAVITPLSQSISMAFSRRESALKALAKYRSAAYNLYVAHSSWDWSVSSKGRGRRGCVENEEDELAVYGKKKHGNDEQQDKYIDWLDHSNTTLSHLTQISDSLYQYLTLPTATRARHRATSKGRKEANEVLSTGREIFTTNIYGRMVMISQLSEALKYRGLPGNEASRIRQWENMMTTAMEDLRIVKEYRTLQALRVFGRLFSLFLPPFYATTFVQVALDTGSLTMGIALGVITSIALTALFESVRQLEDPFVSHVTLDGIDVREELVVLAQQELLVARKMLFPEAEKFVLKRDICEVNLDSNIPANGTDNAECVNRRSRHYVVQKQ